VKDKFIVMNVAIVALAIVGVVAALIFGFAPSRAADAQFKHDCAESGGAVLYGQCYYTEKGAKQ
jgi:hypothetical protein